jgi:hypothetical protein
MLWQIEFDERFLSAIRRANPSSLQKEKLAEAINLVASLADPKSRGGRHQNHWAYQFCNTALLHVKIDDTHNVIRIFEVTF